MITKLTAEQERGVVEWREHCIRIGRDTSSINKTVAEKSWSEFYKILNMEKPLFWYCQSPLQAQIIINIFPEIQKIFKIKKGDNIWDNIWANIGDNIRANIEDNIGDNIGDNIWDNIWANIGDNIRANIGANIGDNIGDNIGANIGDNIRANIRDNIRELKIKYIETYFWCQHSIGWIAYYKYFNKYKLLPYDENFKILDIWYDLACSCGWCYTFENMVFVCEKPSELSIDGMGRLHKDGGMALKYSDGYGLYMLNGIRVPKWLAMTPAEKLDPALALKETNADVQREIIRKIGAERMLKHCDAKTLDTWIDPKTGHTYKLMDMTIGQNIRRRYMYFEHASIPGVFFAKPVPPETAKALHGYAWQRKLIDRAKLTKISSADEAELIANLPAIVC